MPELPSAASPCASRSPSLKPPETGDILAGGHPPHARSAPASGGSEAPVPASTLHVQPNPTGRWIVRHEDDREPVSEHASATEAERVACELAKLEGTSPVLVHDLYARIHCLEIGHRAQRNP